MTDAAVPTPPLVVVTGANGFVGARVCEALVERGATVRGVVRRAGSAPRLRGVEEVVGDFADAGFAAAVVAGADAVVTTVHPMGDDRATQERIGVEGTTTFVRAAAAAGVVRAVHVSTGSVHDRRPGVGDVDETSALVADDANDYAVTKRDTDLAIGEVEGLTRVLLRPPSILGPGETSVWNTLRPAAMADDASERSAIPDRTFSWVHVTDLASLAADLAVGRIAEGTDPGLGPVAGGCTPVLVAADPAPWRAYHETVTTALGLEPVWVDKPGWTGRLLTDRVRRWGWSPSVTLESALAEIAAGLQPA